MKNLSVLTVSVKSDLPKYLIKSFEKFKPSNLNINYIVIENTNDTTYKDDICSTHDNVTWVNNPIQSQPMEGGSPAHANGLHFGLKYVNDDWVFICDHDTCVSDVTFFEEFFKKVDEGFDLIGASYHPQNKVVHPNGMLVKTEIVKEVDLNPEGKWDTASKLTHFVGDNHYIFRNTWNDSSLVDIIDEPYKSWGKECGIDRCLNSNDNIMFIHLGRGTAKFSNLYQQVGKASYQNWSDFVNGILKKDIGEEK